MKLDLSTRLREAVAAGGLGAFTQVVAADLKISSPATVFAAVAELRDGSFDFLSLLREADRGNAHLLRRFVLPAVSRLEEFTADDALVVLRFADVEVSNRHYVAEELKPLFRKLPTLAIELLKVFTELPNPSEGSLFAFAGAFANVQPAEAARACVSLAGQSEQSSCLAAMLLRFLDRDDEAVLRILLASNDGLIAAFRGLTATTSSDAGWGALCLLAPLSDEGMTEVEQILRNGPIEGLSAVANWVMSATGATVGTKALPLVTLLGRLVECASLDSSLRIVVDNTLSVLMYPVTTSSEVLRVVDDFRLSEQNLEDTYPQTLAALTDHPADFTQTLTRWLTAPDSSFKAVSALLSQCISHGAPAALDPVEFSRVEKRQQAWAVRRLLALAHNGEAICQFVAWFAETPAAQPRGLEIAEEMLNYLFVEYPSSTEEFLKRKVGLVSRTSTFSHVYRGVYANTLRWKRVLRQLPNLQELRPTDAQLLKFGQLRARQNAEILRIAEERSVFAQISTKINIRQGHRFASHTKFGPPQIAEMSQLSRSMELPSSERADPVGGILRRAGLLRNAR